MSLTDGTGACTSETSFKSKHSQQIMLIGATWRGGPRRTDYGSNLVWEHFGIPEEEERVEKVKDVAPEEDAWAAQTEFKREMMKGLTALKWQFKPFILEEFELICSDGEYLYKNSDSTQLHVAEITSESGIQVVFTAWFTGEMRMQSYHIWLWCTFFLAEMYHWFNLFVIMGSSFNLMLELKCLHSSSYLTPAQSCWPSPGAGWIFRRVSTPKS